MKLVLEGNWELDFRQVKLEIPFRLLSRDVKETGV